MDYTTQLSCMALSPKVGFCCNFIGGPGILWVPLAVGVHLLYEVVIVSINSQEFVHRWFSKLFLISSINLIEKEIFFGLIIFPANAELQTESLGASNVWARSRPLKNRMTKMFCYEMMRADSLCWVKILGTDLINKITGKIVVINSKIRRNWSQRSQQQNSHISFLDEEDNF